MPVSLSVKIPSRVAAFSCTLTVCFTDSAASSTFCAVRKKRKVEIERRKDGPGDHNDALTPKGEICAQEGRMENKDKRMRALAFKQVACDCRRGGRAPFVKQASRLGERR